jgi:dipeptidyl-peptidase-4
MRVPFVRVVAAATVALAFVYVPLGAQDRLPLMPGYDRYQRMTREIPGSVKLGSLSVRWKDDGSSFEYAWNGKRYVFDVASRHATETGDAPAPVGGGRGGRGGGVGPERGRQFDSAESPDKTLKAFYKDRNLWLSATDGANPVAITTDGSEKDRTKYGTASWVYGEELSQRTAMWWAPDSKRVAYYRFDEKQVVDFYLQMNQTQVQDTLDVEAYPKPGKPNPIVDLFVYDVASKKSTRIDVRDGKPFDNTVVGHYVYNVAWSSDGREILLNRTNRRQNVLEFAACSPESGKCRAVVHEEWPTGWIENRPEMRLLKDGRRFIWESQRSGWKNFYLYDLSGTLIAPLTHLTTAEAENVVLVDEAHGVFYYTARDGDNFMKLQLHRAGLDGKHDTRLTDPAFMHDHGVAGRRFSWTWRRRTTPTPRLIDNDGKIVTELAKSDTTKFDESA